MVITKYLIYVNMVLTILCWTTDEMWQKNTNGSTVKVNIFTSYTTSAS